jgi:ubiquinone/menaquinone biosynthesis C-methylase UbiE
MTTDQRHAQVKEHYRSLAAEYGNRSNQTCERAYRRIVRRFLGDRRRLLELGGGSTDLLESLGAPLAVACDLSLEMLQARPAADRAHRVAAACERLPFPDAHFDGAFCINVLEHVADVDRVLAESARVLEDGGLFLAVTPNGNWETLLDLAERWKLKIPEGAHTFLTTRALDRAVRAHLEVIEHRTMLVLPAGPPALASLIDRVTACSALGWGFFQCIVARKR